MSFLPSNFSAAVVCITNLFILFEKKKKNLALCINRFRSRALGHLLAINCHCKDTLNESTTALRVSRDYLLRCLNLSLILAFTKDGKIFSYTVYPRIICQTTEKVCRSRCGIVHIVPGLVGPPPCCGSFRPVRHHSSAALFESSSATAQSSR